MLVTSGSGSADTRAGYFLNWWNNSICFLLAPNSRNHQKFTSFFGLKCEIGVLKIRFGIDSTNEGSLAFKIAHQWFQCFFFMVKLSYCKSHENISKIEAQTLDGSFSKCRICCFWTSLELCAFRLGSLRKLTRINNLAAWNICSVKVPVARRTRLWPTLAHVDRISWVTRTNLPVYSIKLTLWAKDPVSKCKPNETLVRSQVRVSANSVVKKLNFLVKLASTIVSAITVYKKAFSKAIDDFKWTWSTVFQLSRFWH